MFETSLLALNQVIKEHTTVQMTAAEEFLLRNNCTQCTRELHTNGHKTEEVQISVTAFIHVLCL